MKSVNFSPYPWFATLAFILLLAGFLWRKRNRRLHAGLMTSGMVIDLTLVLLLEFTKDAVATAFGNELTAWQYAHVITSTLAVLFYIPVFALGSIRLLRPNSDQEIRHWHMQLGYFALFFRTLGFLFMFSMLGRA